MNKVTPPASVAEIVPISVDPSSIVNVEAEVNTGATVSTTLTVLVAVPVLPAASVAEYVIVYDPATFVSRPPKSVVTVSPPSASAPASTYVSPSSIVTGFAPKTVITGDVGSFPIYRIPYKAFKIINN